MTKHYHLVIDDDGDAYLQTLDGERLEPDAAKRFANQIIGTANRKLYVYFGYSQAKELYKIGFSKDPEQRAQKLSIGIIHTIVCDSYGHFSARNLERKLHEVFKAVGRWRGNEWVDFDEIDLGTWCEVNSSRECFERADAILNYHERYRPYLSGISHGNLAGKILSEMSGNPNEVIAAGYTLRVFDEMLNKAGYDTPGSVMAIVRFRLFQHSSIRESYLRASEKVRILDFSFLR